MSCGIESLTPRYLTTHCILGERKKRLAVYRLIGIDDKKIIQCLNSGSAIFPRRDAFMGLTNCALAKAVVVRLQIGIALCVLANHHIWTES